MNLRPIEANVTFNQAAFDFTILRLSLRLADLPLTMKINSKQDPPADL
jgi:hypothetical protein